MNPRLKELLEHFKTRPNECIVKDLQMAFDFMSKHDFSNEDIKQATCRLWDEATYKCRRYRPINLYQQSHGNWDRHAYMQANSLINSIKANEDDKDKIKELVGQIDKLLEQTTSIATQLKIRTTLSKVLYMLELKENKYNNVLKFAKKLSVWELPKLVGYNFNDSINKCKIILSSMDLDRSAHSWATKSFEFLEALEKVNDTKGYLLLVWCFNHLLSTGQFFSIDEYVQSKFKNKK